MSNDGSTDSTTSGDFGANDWLVEEMYEAWVKDPTSVEASWIPTLQAYAAKAGNTTAPATAAQEVAAPAAAAPVAARVEPTDNPTGAIDAIPSTSRTTSTGPTNTPIPAQAPEATKPSDATDEAVVSPLKGMAKALASNMDASLTVPTATSVRTVPAN